MNSFSSRSATTIPIPHDPPHEVTICKLSGGKLRQADEARDFALARYIDQMGGATYRESVAAQYAKAAADRKAAGEPPVVSNPAQAFDSITVIKGGTKAWTFQNEDGTPILVTPEAIEDLSAETQEYLAEQILRYTKPSLFADFDKQEAQKKAQADSSVAG